MWFCFFSGEIDIPLFLADLLSDKGGVLVASLKSSAQTPAAWVMVVDSPAEASYWSSSVSDIRRSARDSGGDSKIDPESEPDGGLGRPEAGVQKDGQDGIQGDVSVGGMEGDSPPLGV